METETLVKTSKDGPSFLPSSAETITQKHLLLQRLQAPLTPELLNDDIEMKDSKIPESPTMTTPCSETSLEETLHDQKCSLTCISTSTTEKPVVSIRTSPSSSNTIVCTTSTTTTTSSISTESEDIKVETKDNIQENTPLPSTLTSQTNIVQPVNAKPANLQPVNVQPAITQPVNVQPANVQPVITQPVNVQPVITQPANVQPVIAQPANVQPVTSQYVHVGSKRPSTDDADTQDAKKHKLSTDNDIKTTSSVDQIKDNVTDQTHTPVVTTAPATPQPQQQPSPQSSEPTIVVSTEQQQQQNGSPQELTPTTRRLSSSSSSLASPRTSIEGITDFDIGEQPASVRRKVCFVFL